ncbi:hypothetical protein RB597_010327 [Gaeumannomyces tritici]
MAGLPSQHFPVGSTTITAVGKKCVERFQRCLQSGEHALPRQRSSLEDQLTRFTLWTSNMGVFSGGRTSMDHRLREAPEVHDMLVCIVETLFDHVDNYLKVLDLRSPGQTYGPSGSKEAMLDRSLKGMSKEITMLFRLSNIIRRASRESQDIGAVGDLPIKDEHGNIDKNREPRVKESFMNTLRQLPTSPSIHADLLHSTHLAERLASAMLLRWRRILYMRSRYKRIQPTSSAVTTQEPQAQNISQRTVMSASASAGKQPEAVPSVMATQAPGPSSIIKSSASSERTTTHSTATTLRPEAFKKASTPSIVSNTRTVPLNSHQALDLLPPPRGRFGAEYQKRKHLRREAFMESFEAVLASVGNPEGAGKTDPRTASNYQKATEAVIAEAELLERRLKADRMGCIQDIPEFICPYCFFSISTDHMLAPKKWQSHVLKDIDAYVCLFGNCSDPERLYTHSSGWMSHMREHTRRWRCVLKPCKARDFRSREEYIGHVKLAHTGLFSEKDLQLFADSSSWVTEQLFTVCPFCSAEQDVAAMDAHVIGHMRSFAFKSLLPLDKEVQDQDQDLESDEGYDPELQPVLSESQQPSQYSSRSADPASTTPADDNASHSYQDNRFHGDLEAEVRELQKAQEAEDRIREKRQLEPSQFQYWVWRPEMFSSSARAAAEEQINLTIQSLLLHKEAEARGARCVFEEPDFQERLAKLRRHVGKDNADRVILEFSKIAARASQPGQEQRIMASESIAFEPAGIFSSGGSGGASVIHDFGDNKQLEFISQRSEGLFDHHQQGEHLVTGAGDNFTNTWGGLGTSAFPPQLDVDGEPVLWEGYPSVPEDFHKSLQEDIEDLLVDPKWPHNKPMKKFLPFNKLGELITRVTVEKELIFHGFSAAKASELSAKIVDISSPLTPRPGHYEKTTRRKLFAILVIIDKVRAIQGLIEEGILDKDLPFTQKPNRSARALPRTLWRKCMPPGGGDASMVPVTSMQKWRRIEIDYFHDNQWTVLAPFLQLSNPDAPKVHHYPLEYHSILPFVELEGADDGLEDLMEMQEFTGGCSEVHKIQIHEHHHNLFDPTAPERERNPYFALKILREGTSKEAFDQEVNCLKRLMEENNPSLVRLLGTFKHSNHYYLIFPWADANLEQFIAREYPDPDSPPRDASLARWVSKQLASLASGLKLVHSSPIRKGNKQEMQPVSKKIYGRHGDIKPANILFFRPRDLQQDKGSSLGIFKIADFGFTAFHSLESIEVPAHAVGRSPTHKAPECDGISMSPSSDFWSLGAVMLELMVWYISGREGYNAFNQRRRRNDDTEIMFNQPAQDKYFNNINLTGVPEAPEVKESVRKEMADLRSHQRCSAFIHDVVDFIERRLLVVDPLDRATTHELIKALNAINKKCLDSEDYCSSPIAGRHHPASQTMDESRNSPGSDGDMTAETSFLYGGSLLTRQATITREKMALRDSEDEAKEISNIPRQESRPLAGVPQTVSGLSVPVALENHEPSSRQITRLTGEGASKQCNGGPGGKNSREPSGQDSTSASRQNTLNSGKQPPQEIRARQAGDAGVLGATDAPRRALLKRDAPSSAGTGIRSQEARMPPPVNSRKRKVMDESTPSNPRRSTA